MAHRVVPARANLEQYRKQAKDLLDGIAKHIPAALTRVGQHHPRLQGLGASGLGGIKVRLADAQLVIAREHGFESWPKFSAHLRTLQTAPPDAFQERIRAGEVELPIEVCGRRNAVALVLFVLAGNIGRHHPGIRKIASAFNGASFCTVLADLLTEDEDIQDAVHEELRYDIPLLANRMTAIVDRFAGDPGFQSLPMGLFCSGTGAAAGAITATQRPAAVRAMVCCAGRPDLAGSAIVRINAPTLFVFGGDDIVGQGFMRTLLGLMPPQVPRRLEVIDGAADRFDAAPHVARAALLAGAWFGQHLCGDSGLVEQRA